MTEESWARGMDLGAKNNRMKELMTFPMRPLGPDMYYPREKFDAFAQAVQTLYQRHGKPNRDGVVPFSAKTAHRIRSRNQSSFKVAMRHVVYDIGHVDVLLTIKHLIFD